MYLLFEVILVPIKQPEKVQDNKAIFGCIPEPLLQFNSRLAMHCCNA
jgi:hypothetical protein